jgi:hypothetical protein
MSARTVLAALAVSALALPVTAVPADASGGGDDVRRHGGCDGPAVWRLEVKSEDGRIELEAQVDSNRGGQVWRWTIKHNGSRSARGSSTTSGDSDSFRVRRRMADLAGTDHFAFRAVRRKNGDVCHGRISL